MLSTPKLPASVRRFMFLLKVVGEFDYVAAYNGCGVLTTVYTPVGKAEQVRCRLLRVHHFFQKYLC